jgi:hypothetical protein
MNETPGCRLWGEHPMKWKLQRRRDVELNREAYERNQMNGSLEKEL